MNKVTVIASVIAAGFLAAPAQADFIGSKGQVIRTSPKTTVAATEVKDASQFDCRITQVRAERMPTGGVRQISKKVCPHKDQLAAGKCITDPVQGMRCVP
jgi:hypothetical protein